MIYILLMLHDYLRYAIQLDAIHIHISQLSLSYIVTTTRHCHAAARDYYYGHISAMP